MTGNVGILDTANRSNLRLLILLRWLAVGGQLATICIVHFGMGVALPLGPMFTVLWLLVGLNALGWLRLRRPKETRAAELFFGLLADILALTAQLYMSGGASNPFISLFLLQVMLGAVLLDLRRASALAGVAIVAFLVLTVRSMPLTLPPEIGTTLFYLHIQGMLVCFLLTVLLLLVFVRQVTRNIRQRDERVAELRQKSAEEDHIVRMGLLAAGAAHELGTPLATLSVILNDWRRLPFFRKDAEAASELALMEAELDRCKTIVRGILISSGEPRGDGVVRTTVRQFVDDCVEDWRQSRTPTRFDYANRYSPDTPMISDVALKQVIGNVLDNALEASPDWVGIDVRRDGDRLAIVVSDKGPGFAPEVMERLGRPYTSTKPGAGRGLGLFLVTNVVRKLGGTVSAGARTGGGSVLNLSLPLEGLTPAPAPAVPPTAGAET
jgi:two-component system sensor histidine kinase RegB